jgi:hypothetical protein
MGRSGQEAEGIYMTLIRSAVICVMAMGSLTLTTGAKAATISTYSFTQTGYHGGSMSNGLTAVLSGSFSGTVENSGIIGQSDLTNFSFTLTIYNTDHSVFAVPLTGNLSDLALFSYDTTGSPSALDISSQNPVGVCVGAAAAFGLCGGSGYAGSFTYLDSAHPIVPGSGEPFLWTSEAPQIALTVATTPIPPALPLFASALAALGLFGWTKRRSLPVPAA